jgi:hypothetical protein
MQLLWANPLPVVVFELNTKKNAAITSKINPMLMLKIPQRHKGRWLAGVLHNVPILRRPARWRVFRAERDRLAIPTPIELDEFGGEAMLAGY